MSYHVGDNIRFACSFTNIDGVAADPTDITLYLRQPDGTTVTLEFPANVTRDSVGEYHYDRTMESEGIWYWRWVGEGAIEQADQGVLLVLDLTVEV